MGILGIARTVGKIADNAADAAKTVARNKAVTGLMTKAEDAIPSTAFTKAIDDIPTQPVTRQVSNAEYDSAWSSFEDINTPEEWQSAVKKTVAGDRDITGNSPIRRTPELEASAKKLIDDKLITREEHLANIAENKPINDWDQLPREPSSKSVVYALKPNQRSDGRFLVPKEDANRLGVEVATLKSGDKFNGRLDIPAYQDYDTWIVAGTKSGEKGTTYAKAIHYTSGEGKPVRFLASQKTSEKIGKAEEGKTGYATISGYYKDSSPEELRILSERYLNDPEWSQVGFDPRRLGSFYLRKANDLVGDVGTPLGEADEVIQIGPLVLAKNAKAIEGYSGYNKGGVVTPMNFNKGGTPMLGKQMELFADGGLKDEGGSVDEVSGNDVPTGSLKEEVRDDIPAKLSEGEFVLPADVVRFYGLAHIMKMRDIAKAGLAKMDAMGQMGNSDEAIMEDDMPFSMEDLEVEDEEGNSLEYADGGFVRKFEVGGYNPSTGTTTQTGTGIYQTPNQPTIGMNRPATSYTPFTPTVQPNVVPTSFQPKFLTTPAPTVTQLPTFEQVQGGTGSPIQKTKKYKDANGNIIEIPLDAAGNPIYAPPEGYVPDTGELSPVIPLPSTGSPSIPDINANNDNDREYVRPTSNAPTNWGSLDYQGVVDAASNATNVFGQVLTGIVGSVVAPGIVSNLVEKQRTTVGKALINAYLGLDKNDVEKKAQLEKLWTKHQSLLKQLTGNTTTLIDSIPKDAKYVPPVKAPAINSATANAALLGAALTGEAARSYDESIRTGYTGSSVNNIAVGNKATLDSDGNIVSGNAGVLTNADGTVKKATVEGYTHAIYVDSAGIAYVEGIFGTNRRQVDAQGNVIGKYEGPADAKKKKTEEEKAKENEVNGVNVGTTDNAITQAEVNKVTAVESDDTGDGGAAAAAAAARAAEQAKTDAAYKIAQEDAARNAANNASNNNNNNNNSGSGSSSSSAANAARTNTGSGSSGSATNYGSSSSSGGSNGSGIASRSTTSSRGSTASSVGVSNSTSNNRGSRGSETTTRSTRSATGSGCFIPETCIDMADGTTKEIANIRLGDAIKGGTVIGLHTYDGAPLYEYRGVKVSGTHYVIENAKAIMVKDTTAAVKIDDVYGLYTLDTTDRRIFSNGIEFADHNGDGVIADFFRNMTGKDMEQSVLDEIEIQIAAAKL